MVKPTEVALCLVIRCLLLCNIFETPGHFVRELYSGYLIQTLHLLYHDKSMYV
jgi:hypothetical protein